MGCYPGDNDFGGSARMLAIAAAGAFVGLFVLWVVLPRKLLRNKSKTPRTPRPVRRRGAPAPAPQTSE